MKIAIYGDSFSIIHTKWQNPDMETEYPPALYGYGWTELLAQQHEVDNFAVSGSAFMYSYEKFLQNHMNYDLNIFVITNATRMYIKALDGIFVFGTYWVREEIKRLEKMPWYEKKADHIEILKSVDVYLDKWIDWDMMLHTQHVLVDNLWKINPNTICIPAFDDSMQGTSKNLFDLAKYELKLVDEAKFNAFDFLWLNCQRKCHFSAENNKMIYDKLLVAIEKKDKVFIPEREDIVRPSKDFDFYVKSNKHENRF